MQDTRTLSSSTKNSSVKIRKRQHTPYTSAADISSLQEIEISAKRPTKYTSKRLAKHSTPQQDIAPEKTRGSSLKRVRFQKKTQEETSRSVSRGIFKNMTNADLSSVSPCETDAGRPGTERDIQESSQQERNQECEEEQDNPHDEDMDEINELLHESVIRGNTDSEASEVEEDVKPALSQLQAQVQPSPPAMNFRELLTQTQPTQETQETMSTVKKRNRMIVNRPDSSEDDNGSGDGSESGRASDASLLSPKTSQIIKKSSLGSRRSQSQSSQSQLTKSQQIASDKSGSDTETETAKTPQIVKKSAAKMRKSRGQSSPDKFKGHQVASDEDGSETETESSSPISHMKTPKIKSKSRKSLRRYQNSSHGDIPSEASPTPHRSDQSPAILEKSRRRPTRKVFESSDSETEKTLEEQSASDEKQPVPAKQELSEPMDTAQGIKSESEEDEQAGSSSREASDSEHGQVFESVSLERIKKGPGVRRRQNSVSSESDHEQAEESESKSDALLPSLETVCSPPSIDTDLERQRMTSFLNDSILASGEMPPERARGARKTIDPLVQLKNQASNRSASQEEVQKETGFTLESPSIDQLSSVGELKIVESESGREERSDKENNPPSENEDNRKRTPSTFTRANSIRRKKASQTHQARESILSSERRAPQPAQTPSTIVQGSSSSSQSPGTAHKRTRSFRRRTKVVKDPKEMPTPTPPRRRLKPVEENDELSIGCSDSTMQVDEKPKGLVAINHVEVIHESASQMSCDSEHLTQPKSSASQYQSPQAGSQSSTSSVDYMTPDEDEEEFDDPKSVQTFTSSTLNVSNPSRASTLNSRAVNISKNTTVTSVRTLSSGSRRGRTISEEDSEDYGSDAGNSSFQAMTGIAPVASSEYLSVGTICSPPARAPRGREGF